MNIPDILKALLVGGAICLIGQLLIDYTKLTPARVLVTFTVAGVLLTAVGLWQPVVKWAGEGALLPIVGFGHTLAKGVKKACDETGILGALTGGLTGAAAGITAAVVFGFIFAMVSKPKAK